MTYSIVALSLDRKMLGVATASGSLAVGSRVPWAKAKVGAIATQAYTNPALGPLILKLLIRGYSAEEALRKALAEDKEREKRQVAVIDYRGNKAYYNGMLIPEKHSAYVAKNSICIGNLLANAEIPKIMCKTFERKCAEDFAYALLSALAIAHRLGGDRRGDRSAALLVVSETPYGALYDRIVDLRVDFSPNPVQELIELYEIHRTLK